MTKLTLYGLKNCDTCKKAMKALDEKNVTYSFIDIRAEADLEAKLPIWLTAVGVEKLLNKRSTTWRSLSKTEQQAALSDKTQITLQNNPTLIKRPVIETKNSVFVGWTKECEQQLF